MEQEVRMRYAWLVVAASVASSCATAGAKAVPLPPGRPALSDARATVLWDRLGAELSELEIAELRSLSRDDPSREIRLAATWVLGHSKGKATPAVDDPSEQPPKILHQTPPRYPADANRRRIQGQVLVEFLIDEQGRVAHAEARESIPALDAAAVATISAWRFEPAQIGGKPIIILAQAPVRFRID
jgi:TonB family protein